MVRRAALGALVIALPFGGGCSSQPETTPVVRDPPPAFQNDAFVALLEEDAESFTFWKGQWVESLGDAPFYGLAFYAHAAPGSPHEALWNARVQEARTYALGLLSTNPLIDGDVQQMAMAAFGIIDVIDATARRDDLPVLDSFLDRFDALVKLLGWYIQLNSSKNWAFGVYGPTSIAALIGLLNAQYALLVGGERAADRAAWAIEMATHIDEHAWNGTFYTFGVDNHDEPSLYPNVAMIAFQARLYELTHEEAYRTRALALYDAIQPLKLPDGRYYSEYSAAALGATTHDFSTLSSQNYLILALALLYEITGHAKYITEADQVVNALRTKMHGTWCLSELHAELCSPACATPSQVCVVSTCEKDACHGGMLHHWIDGRPAKPSDSTYFCSGCNLQLLYGLWYRTHQIERFR